MATKTKAPPRSAAVAPLIEQPATAPWATPPWTTEERLQRIRVMGQQITGYVEYMCQIDKLTGTSAEAKERAVTLFYERMVVFERQLNRVQEELHLG